MTRYMDLQLITTVVTRHHTFQTPDTPGTGTLVTKSLECSVLATCRTINNEATSTFAPKLAELRTQPLRLMLQRSAAPVCNRNTNVLCDRTAVLAERVFITFSLTNPATTRNASCPQVIRSKMYISPLVRSGPRFPNLPRPRRCLCHRSGR